MSLLSRSVPRSASSTALAIGAGRVAFGAGLVAAPDRCLRLLGVDGGSARRMAFLATMVGARDLGIGGGTVLSRRSPGGRSWLVAGAVADAADAVALAAAARRGTVRPIAGYGGAAFALSAVVTSVYGAVARR